MAYEIKKAAVLGAGVMGATIAAHLTNAGIECVLLDIIPFELTEADKAQGLTEKSPAWRNRFAANGLAGVMKSKPAGFYTKKNASMIKVGNFEDNLGWLADVDWVIEVVIENLKIKQELFAKVEKIVKPDCIVTTNTSGIPIKDITAKFGSEAEGAFSGDPLLQSPPVHEASGDHPREGNETRSRGLHDPILRAGAGEGRRRLQGRPQFHRQPDRFFDISNAVRLMVEKNLKIDEVDAIIGKALGRPGTSIFGTLDLVGLDTGHHVMKNLYAAVPDDEMREMFVPGEFMNKMMELKWLGNKTKQGFYKRTKDAKGKKAKLMLDYHTMEYVPAGKPKFESVSDAKKKTDEGVAATIKVMFNGTDIAAELTREYLCNNFIYAANRIPEICDNIVGIDNAMKWGYNHQLGPFETWDAVGVREAVEVMKKLKKKVPKKIEEMLKKGFETFYAKKGRRPLFLRLRKEGLCEAGGESPDHPPARSEGAEQGHQEECQRHAGRHRRRRGLPRIPYEDERRRRRDDRDDLCGLRHRGEGFRRDGRGQPRDELLGRGQHLQGPPGHPDGGLGYPRETDRRISRMPICG